MFASPRLNGSSANAETGTLQLNVNGTPLESSLVSSASGTSGNLSKTVLLNAEGGTTVQLLLGNTPTVTYDNTLMNVVKLA